MNRFRVKMALSYANIGEVCLIVDGSFYVSIVDKLLARHLVTGGLNGG